MRPAIATGHTVPSRRGTSRTSGRRRTRTTTRSGQSLDFAAPWQSPTRNLPLAAAAAGMWASTKNARSRLRARCAGRKRAAPLCREDRKRVPRNGAGMGAARHPRQSKKKDPCSSGSHERRESLPSGARTARRDGLARARNARTRLRAAGFNRGHRSQRPARERAATASPCRAMRWLGFAPRVHTGADDGNRVPPNRRALGPSSGASPYRGQMRRGFARHVDGISRRPAVLERRREAVAEHAVRSVNA